MIRNTLVVAVCLLALTAFASGVYDPNNTHTSNDTNGDGDMSITAHSGSSASASTGVRESGNGSETLWHAELSMMNRSQNTELAGTITDVSFHETADDKQAVRFTGYVQTPTPCHTVDHDITEQDGTYVFTVQTQEPSGDHICTQVLTTVAYNASFKTDAPYTLDVKHGDTTVDTLEIPEAVAHPNEPQQLSILEAVLSWFHHLF